MVSHLNSAAVSSKRIQPKSSSKPCTSQNPPVTLRFPGSFELSHSCSVALAQAGSDIWSLLWTNHYDVHDWTPCVGIHSALLSDCLSLILCGGSCTPLPKHICHVLSQRYSKQPTPTSNRVCSCILQLGYVYVHERTQNKET